MNLINFKDQDFNDDHAVQVVEWVEDCLKEFAETNAFASLSERERKSAGFILGVFFEYCYSYYLVSPNKINIIVIDDILLYVFPRNITAEIDTFESVENVLIVFLKWVNTKKSNYFKNINNLCQHISSVAPTMIKLSQDKKNWGVAKSLLYRRRSKSNSRSNVGKSFTKIINYVKDFLKIGTNEICSCGSGKKYKECCGTHT